MRLALTALFLWASSLGAIDPDRDFTGRWQLDARASDSTTISVPPPQSLEVSQQGLVIECSSPMPGAGIAHWSYRTDGAEAAAQIGNETHNSAVKWEGSALLVNTLVSGSRNYVIMDRWKLSHDHARLTISRQVMRGTSQTEGVFVYCREGQIAATAGVAPARGALSPRVEPPAAAEYVIPAGTHILLTMINSVNTKHSREGDRIYLESAVPVFWNGRVVIPRGSAVAGTVTESKKAGRVTGRAELYLRFDSITLPNGVTRDLRSRLGSAETAGQVDRKEGKVTGESNKSGDARTVAEGTAIGASVGGVAGSAAGHAGQGLGTGAAAGAAVGLAGVLLRRGPEAVVPRGTRVEMILDRDLHFTGAELR